MHDEFSDVLPESIRKRQIEISKVRREAMKEKERIFREAEERNCVLFQRILYATAVPLG